MPRFADHLYRDGPANPFPGIKALERRLGREIPHRLGSNEGLDMPHRALEARFGTALCELARGYGDAGAMGVRTRLATALEVELDNLLVDAGADSLLALSLRAVAPAGTTVVTSAGSRRKAIFFRYIGVTPGGSAASGRLLYFAGSLAAGQGVGPVGLWRAFQRGLEISRSVRRGDFSRLGSREL